MTSEQNLTLGQMRASGVRNVIGYCTNQRCICWTRISAEHWPDHVRLSELEDQFVCGVCGRRGADVRPDFEREPQTQNS